MNEKEKWVMDFTDYEEDDRDLMGIGEAILRVTLALVVLGSVVSDLGTTPCSIHVSLRHCSGVRFQGNNFS